MTATMLSPRLTFLTRIEVEVGAPIDMGVVGGAHRRIVPILGGTLSGPELTGRVVPGGADFQVLHPDGRQELEAKYAVEAADGTRFWVENHGLRSGDPADMERLARGEQVDPSRIYFRSAPRISAPAGSWQWLNGRLLVASGERDPGAVRLEVYVVD